MNREDGARWRKAVSGEAHIGRGKCRMPVMGMKDIGVPSSVEDTARQLRRHPAEQGEARRIVGPITPLGIDIGTARSIEAVRSINDVDPNTPLREPSLQNPDPR